MTPLENSLSFDLFCDQPHWLSRQSLIAGWMERLHWPCIDVVDDELMTRTRARSNAIELNNVFSTRFDENNLERDLHRCLNILHAEATDTRWYLGTHDPSARISEQLAALGFDDVQRLWVMAKELKQLRSLKQPENSDNRRMNIDRVRNESTLKQWMSVFAEIYNFSSHLEADWLDMLLSIGFSENTAWRHYYCRVEGKIVGVASALWTDQVTHIEGLGVHRKYRRLNVGANLLHRIMGDAYKAGYEVLIAHCDDTAKDFYVQQQFESFGAIDCVSVPSDAYKPARYRAPGSNPKQPIKNSLRMLG